MDAKPLRNHENEEPEYVDEFFSEDSEIDPWSEEEEEGSKTQSPLDPAAKADKAPSPPPLLGEERATASLPRRRISPRKSAPPVPRFPGRPSTAFKQPAGKKPAEEIIHGREGVVRAEGTSDYARPPQEPPTPRLMGEGQQVTGRKQPPETVQATVLQNGTSLEALIESHQPLPQGSLILGVDEAGKPLVFALDDPSLGALLFMADDSGANRKHLRAVLASAALLTDPDLLQIDVITQEPSAFETESSSLRRVCAPDDECVFGLLGDVLTAMEFRLRDARMLPFQLLVLDEIDVLVEGLAEDSLRFLRWIMRRGPQVGIWPLATIASDRLESFDRKTFRAFGFHLYGRMAQPQATARYVRVPAHLLKRLDPGSQGYMKVEKDNIAFSIPATS